MNTLTPRYLLYSEARRKDPGLEDERQQLFHTADHRETGGQWRFVLESLDGASVLDVADDEDTNEGDRLELLAVVRGLEALEQPSRVTLVTASQYVSRGMRLGLAEWRNSEWHWERFGRLVPIKHRDLWIRIDRAMQFHQVECRAWRFESPAIDTQESDSLATALGKPSRQRRASFHRSVPLRVWWRWLSFWKTKAIHQLRDALWARPTPMVLS